MGSSKYIFPLSIQLPAVDDLYSSTIRRKFLLLQKYGFSGVELNITNLTATDPQQLKKYLADFGLKMTMLASGALAIKHNLSLSHENKTIRKNAVQIGRQIIQYAAEFDAGVILGFMKGAAGEKRETAQKLFQESLHQIGEAALKSKVPVLIEATNHYESSVANTVAEAASLIKGFDNPYLRVLPDTYHMNIEEESPFGALVKYQDLYDSLHISDNNRFYPGLGRLDFFALFAFLAEIGYEGGVAIEGNLKHSFTEDLEMSLEYLQPALQK